MKKTSVYIPEETKEVIKQFQTFWKQEMGIRISEAEILRKILDEGTKVLKQQYRF